MKKSTKKWEVEIEKKQPSEEQTQLIIHTLPTWRQAAKTLLQWHSIKLSATKPSLEHQEMAHLVAASRCAQVPLWIFRTGCFLAGSPRLIYKRNHALTSLADLRRLSQGSPLPAYLKRHSSNWITWPDLQAQQRARWKKKLLCCPPHTCAVEQK